MSTTTTFDDVGFERQEPDSPDEDASIEAVHGERPDAWPADVTLKEVGHGRPRLEGVAKVTGRARYTTDVRVAGQLEAAVLRSPHPHARVRSIDVSAAKAAPGVHAVLCMNDNDDLGISWYAEGVPLFCPVARYVGDEVAVVAADTRRAAEDALALIDVDWEVLPHVSDMERALDDGAPTVHDDGNLVEEPETYERGDAEAALARADITVEGTWTTPTQVHHALEPHASVAEWRSDTLVLHESTQGVHQVRKMMADALGLPLSKARVLCEHMGGGFGAKQVPWKHSLMAAVLARRTGRPVAIALDRRAEALAVGNRNPTRQDLRLGAASDGTLLAIDVRVRRTPGAYSPPGESSNIAGMYKHLYACENVRTRQETVYTHHGPAVAFRAPGYVESCFALETAMDELAEKLGMDPLELRLKNYAERDQVEDLPWSSPDGLRTAYERLGWQGSVSADSSGDGDAPSSPSGRRIARGRGLAAHEWMAGFGSPPAYARVVVQTDGSVELLTGTQDIGTGTRTILAQVAAESLGVPFDAVGVRLGDTGNGLYAPTSSGSFTTPTMGPVVRSAALDAKAKLLDAAATLLQAESRELDLVDGHVVRGDGTEALSLADLAGEVAPHTVFGDGVRLANPSGTTVRPFGAQSAEVEVDLDTGEVVLTRIVSAPECGRLLNRRTAKSQVLGGVTQGIGYALTEERVVDHDMGRVMNANLEDYLLPTMLDSPDIVHAEVDLPDTNANHLGVKGLGELPLIPAAPAILNAVHDAIGVRFRALPLTRRAVLDALAARDAATDGVPTDAVTTGDAS